VVYCPLTQGNQYTGRKNRSRRSAGSRFAGASHWAGFTRQKLFNEARTVFGFSRTGPALQQVIYSAIEKLLAKGYVICMRLSYV
jgi:hypothetical protein